MKVPSILSLSLLLGSIQASFLAFQDPSVNGVQVVNTDEETSEMLAVTDKSVFFKGDIDKIASFTVFHEDGRSETVVFNKEEMYLQPPCGNRVIMIGTRYHDESPGMLAKRLERKQKVSPMGSNPRNKQAQEQGESLMGSKSQGGPRRRTGHRHSTQGDDGF